MFHSHLDYFRKPPLGGRPNTKIGRLLIFANATASWNSWAFCGRQYNCAAPPVWNQFLSARGTLWSIFMWFLSLSFVLVWFYRSNFSIRFLRNHSKWAEYSSLHRLSSPPTSSDFSQEKLYREVRAAWKTNSFYIRLELVFYAMALCLVQPLLYMLGNRCYVLI